MRWPPYHRPCTGPGECQGSARDQESAKRRTQSSCSASGCAPACATSLDLIRTSSAPATAGRVSRTELSQKPAAFQADRKG
eukprot:7172130-Alexandrium_andersonii.AAC.1